MTNLETPQSNWTEEQKEKWRQKFAEFNKEWRRSAPVKRNQLSLWIGRLVIAHNDLENLLAFIITQELSNVFVPNPVSPSKLGVLSEPMQRAASRGLREITMASMSFKQKIDFLAALLYGKSSSNPNHLEHIKRILHLATTADDYRNSIVHCIWQENLGDFKRIKAKIKGKSGLRISQFQADAKELRSAVSAIKLIEDICLICLSEPEFADKAKDGFEVLAKFFTQATTPQKPENLE